MHKRIEPTTVTVRVNMTTACPGIQHVITAALKHVAPHHRNADCIRVERIWNDYDRDTSNWAVTFEAFDGE